MTHAPMTPMPACLVRSAQLPRAALQALAKSLQVIHQTSHCLGIGFPNFPYAGIQWMAGLGCQVMPVLLAPLHGMLSDVSHPS